MLEGSYTAAILEDVEVFVHCGLHPWEQHPERPNRLLVSLWLYGRLPPGAYIDYDPLRNLIVGWQERPHVDLLETLTQEIIGRAMENPLVSACRVRIVKPDIFNETKAAGVEAMHYREGVR